MHRLAAVALAAIAAAGPAFPQEDAPKPAPAKEDYQAKTERHKKNVLRLRGLEFKTDVTVGAYTKTELVDFLKAEFEKELPPEKAGRFQRAYAKFGLIPKDLDLYQAYMDLFGSSIAGFYHPKTKELKIIRAGEEDDLESRMAKAAGIDMEGITFVHELTHAAQDQNFELSTLPLEDETNDDLIAALKSVIEGDASAVGWKYQFKENFDLAIGMVNQGYKTGQLPGKADKLPAYLKLSLTFPYGHGTDFVVNTLKGTGGDLKDASKLLKDWPISTEQILHPAKYWEQRDHPTLVLLPGADRVAGWTETLSNVHGEFGVWMLLREFRSDKLRLPVIKKASEGWDGDRYIVLEDEKKNTGYVWLSTWDTEDDAKEFFEAYVWALHKKLKLELPERADGDRLAIAEGGVLLERRGNDVLVLEGLSEPAMGKPDAFWKLAKKSEMTGFERLKKFVCAKDGVHEAFSGKCPTCLQPLKFDDEVGKPKKKKEFSVEPR
jgi:hypothetical protein